MTMSQKESRSSKLIPYEDGKFWFHKKGSILTIGISADALETIGEAEAVQLPEEGDEVSKDDSIAEVDGVDGALTIYSPVSGTITEVNSALEEDIAVLNEDSIDEGWLVKLKIADEDELKEYL